VTKAEREKQIVEILAQRGELDSGAIAGAFLVERCCVDGILLSMTRRRILARRKIRIKPKVGWDRMPCTPWRYLYRVAGSER